MLRESVRIAFTYPALNELEFFASDIQNAYLQTLASKNIILFVDQSLGVRMWVRL